jgi:hypothetical protein
MTTLDSTCEAWSRDLLGVFAGRGLSASASADRGDASATAAKQCEAPHCTSHVTRHTSHVTRHTLHVTRHTSHATRHTSHATLHLSYAHVKVSGRCPMGER